ncbi:nitrogenase component 1 [Rhodospirillum rubrum]|uniref:Nitrogenase n=1 Tax=Rhodospirillum rubrum (strain ATCC 11170 / ATH 1.1.1 / DSM 467 / LMG 4362 / NCIMB 8255 / S1) TaxID=269796 RepID=Q2RWB8_RHORT|nr:nitrogenase component 1 [Rhodospirillum rubrum]ABC21577.1 Nitrogenase [Rhodospirillum rubrum ATCC 11170]AEO47263.1 nitrogenase [Rhodospirillum rubrum F11]MBK5955811.1 nitrogenase [Rhodospirillum rubrum]QXG81247.1 nitrogenase [Rhodospirillum rubrum]HAP98504.1 nitrogenase [Rhodospirillum rubrum]
MTKIEKPLQPVEIRERRLGSITGYSGTAGDLVARSRDGSLANRERSFQQASMCAGLCATLNLTLIEDAVVINHAPVGCAGDFAQLNRCRRRGQGKRAMEVTNARLLSTALTEHDTIFGGAQKLAETIDQAVARYHPRAIFVTASCASGIVGEDIDSVVTEAEERHAIPVVAIDCVGFRTQVWATGFDMAYDALLRKIVKPAVTKRPEVVNIVCFSGKKAYFSELLEPLGLVANPIVQFLTVAEIETLSEAGATAHMCPTLGTWLGAGLERRFGVPEVKAPPPYGLAGTDHWLRALAALTGRSDRVEAYIAAERAAIAPDLADLRAQLAGRTAFVAAGSAQGHSFMTVLRDLGIDVIGGCALHHDPVLDHGHQEEDTLAHATRDKAEVPYGVCNKQSFELINLVGKLKPDILLIRHPGLVVWGAKLGIPTLYVEDEHAGIGYRGLIRYGRKIADWIANPVLERTLARRSPLPFTPWWLDQSPYQFLES